MKISATILIMGFLFFGWKTISQDFYPKKTAERIIKKALRIKEIALSDGIELTKGENKEDIIKVYNLKYNSSDDPKIALFSQTKGRHDSFDYLIVLSDELKIEKVRIVKYRSEYGGAVASKKWLEQFEGYSSGTLKYGEDISAVSGATISAKSITEDIPKVVSALKDHLN